VAGRSDRSLFSAPERFRLWWSYQRYALALGAGAVGIVVGIAAAAPAVWWLWLAATVPVYKLVEYTWQVARNYPRKLRATALATRRIEAGRFRPRSVAPYCGDPCFRVVAREILRRARIPTPERRQLIAELSRAHRLKKRH